VPAWLEFAATQPEHTKPVVSVALYGGSGLGLGGCLLHIAAAHINERNLAAQFNASRLAVAADPDAGNRSWRSQETAAFRARFQARLVPKLRSLYDVMTGGWCFLLNLPAWR
jgi:hypothetical protein